MFSVLCSFSTNHYNCAAGGLLLKNVGITFSTYSSDFPRLENSLKKKKHCLNNTDSTHD